MSTVQVMFSGDEVRRRIERIAQEMREDYSDKNPLLIAVLKGSFVFLADLVRAINMPLEVDFVRLSSYGSGTESSGRIKVVHRLGTTVKGRHVIVVEDIVDSGLTLSFFMDELRRRRPASLRLCALLDKPSRRIVPVSIDYLCFTVPEKFVVGYGIDCDEKFRYLPEVCYLED
ncbi:MAG: hypoxanthine phosphoribosyltransferase [Chloroflexota bacterium]